MDIELPNGPFTLSQAADLGISPRRLRDLVSARLVRRLFTGVYLCSAIPADRRRYAAGAALVLPSFGVTSDRSAALIHEVDTYPPWAEEIIPNVDTAVLSDKTALRRKGCNGCKRALTAADIVVVDGVPVTSKLRTALDLGCLLRRYEALITLDQFLRQGDVSKEDLIRESGRYAGRRGVVQLRELCQLADGRSESTGESWTRLAIIDADLPVPQLQVWVEDDYGEPIFRLDLAYILSKIAIEYDGKRFHKTKEQRRRDEARRRWLRDRGWIVIVVTKERLRGQALMCLIQEIRDALAARRS